MKNLIIITTHSFVSLITNSSSEIFICDTDKTIETIKDILTDLAEKHDIPGDSLFQTIIKEPTICKYNFNIKDYPGYVEYRQFHGWDWNNKSLLEQETDRKWREWEDNNEDSCPRSPYKYGTEEYKLNQDTWYKNVYQKYLNSKKYKDYREKYNKAYREIHKDLDNKRKSTEESMMRWAFELNNIPYIPVPRPEGLYSFESEIWKDWQKKDQANVEFNEAWNNFSQAAGYGYTLKKGSILIESQEDNSIPWDLMDDITAVFSARRIHVG